MRACMTSENAEKTVHDRALGATPILVGIVNIVPGQGAIVTKKLPNLKNEILIRSSDLYNLSYAALFSALAGFPAFPDR